MEPTSVVDAARQSLGPVGAYLPTPFTSTPPVDLQREAASRLERVGYRTVWTNEPVGGRRAPGRRRAPRDPHAFGHHHR